MTCRAGGDVDRQLHDRLVLEIIQMIFHLAGNLANISLQSCWLLFREDLTTKSKLMPKAGSSCFNQCPANLTGSHTRSGMKAEYLGNEVVFKWFTAYLPEKDFGRYLDFVDRQFRYLKINLIEFN